MVATNATATIARPTRLITDPVGAAITDARSRWTMAAIRVIVHKSGGLAKKEGGAEAPPLVGRRLLRGGNGDVLDGGPGAALVLLDLQGRGRRVTRRVEGVGPGEAREVGSLGHLVDDLLPGRHVAAVGVDRAPDGVDQDGGAVVAGEGVGRGVARVRVRLLVGGDGRRGAGVRVGVRNALGGVHVVVAHRRAGVLDALPVADAVRAEVVRVGREDALALLARDAAV